MSSNQDLYIIKETFEKNKVCCHDNVTSCNTSQNMWSTNLCACSKPMQSLVQAMPLSGDNNEHSSSTPCYNCLLLMLTYVYRLYIYRCLMPSLCNPLNSGLCPTVNLSFLSLLCVLNCYTNVAYHLNSWTWWHIFGLFTRVCIPKYQKRPPIIL